MFNWKSEEDIREETDQNLNENVQAEMNAEAGSVPEQAETPGSDNGEGTAGNTAEERRRNAHLPDHRNQRAAA